MKRLIDKLHQEQMLTAEEFHRLLANRSEETDQYARELANQVRQEVYGNKIYVRGLIEFTNYCKNNCYYCGIRRDNRCASRYRLTEEELGQDAYDLLETVGRKRGMLMSGGVVNTERAAITLVDEFRGAKLGRVSLERPEEA